VIACGQGINEAYYSFYSALLIHLLIRYISGVAMLERKQSKRADFRVYMLETNAFIPWFYRPVKAEMKQELIEKF